MSKCGGPITNMEILRIATAFYNLQYMFGFFKFRFALGGKGRQYCTSQEAGWDFWDFIFDAQRA